MEELLKSLIENRAKAWEQGKQILDRIQAAGDKAEAADEEQWQKINDELDRLDERIDQLTKKAEASKRADEALAGLDLRPTGEPTQSPDAALVEWMRAHQRAKTSGEPVARTFEVSLAGLVNVVDPMTGKREIRNAQSTSTQGIVPTGFAARLYEHLIENSAIRQTNVEVLTTTGGGAIELPRTVLHMTATQVAEGGTIPSVDGTITKATVSAYKYGNLVKVSSELLTDDGLPEGVFLGYLARSGGQAIANDQGADFLRGDGSSKPQGLLVGGTHVGKHLSGTLSADALIELQYSVIDPYARNGWWIMSRQTAGAARRMKDGGGAYVWAAGLGGAPNTILDRPYVTDPNMMGPSTATSATQVVFGDISRYTIRDVATVRFERSDDFAFDTDEVAFRVLMRSDGVATDITGAWKSLTGATY